jgi:hypothetical protein
VVKALRYKPEGRGIDLGGRGRLGGTPARQSTVGEVSEPGTEATRTKKQRLDRSDEKLAIWKRTRMRGGQQTSQPL